MTTPQPPQPPPPLQVRRRTTRGETEMELSLDVPSDLEYVGPAVELLADQLPGGPLSPRRIRFNFRTAFAEALANAIAYGNHRDPGRLVRVRVEVARDVVRSEEHTSELQSRGHLVCRLLLEKKKPRTVT